MPEKLDFKENFTRNGLQFGSELSVAFANGISPLIKCVMVQAYGNLYGLLGMYSLDQLLTNEQGDIDERLNIKDALSRGELKDWSKGPAAALLWVLRHFLGLLPTPLLVKRVRERKYAWWKFSIHCRISYEHRNESRNKRIIAAIALEMMRLPKENFDLMCLVMDLFRRLCVHNYGEAEEVNKKTVESLSRYFTASICVRPYRPGNETIIDKQYYPLVKFMIEFWPQIWNICAKLENDHSDSSLLPGSNHYDDYGNCIISTADRSAQTCEFDCGSARYTAVNDQLSSYLKDAECQTDVKVGADEDLSSENEVEKSVAELKYGGGDKEKCIISKETTTARYGNDVVVVPDIVGSHRSETSNGSGPVTYYVEEDTPAALNLQLPEDEEDVSIIVHQSAHQPPPPSLMDPVFIISCENVSTRSSTGSCCTKRKNFDQKIAGHSTTTQAYQEWMVVNKKVFEELKEKFRIENRLQEAYYVKNGGIFNRLSADEYFYDDELSYSYAKSSAEGESAKEGTTQLGYDDDERVEEEEEEEEEVGKDDSFNHVLDKIQNLDRWKRRLRFGADCDCNVDDADANKEAQALVEKEKASVTIVGDLSNVSTDDKIIDNVSIDAIVDKSSTVDGGELSKNAKEPSSARKDNKSEKFLKGAPPSSSFPCCDVSLAANSNNADEVQRSPSDQSLLGSDKAKASRLDLSKIFTSAKKSTTKKQSNSKSFHTLRSKIKYKKMQSVSAHK